MFKKAKLSLALSAMLAAGTFAGSAQAVNLTPDNLGDAGLFQYYSAVENEAGDWRTFVRIVNTSDEAVLVKVRFREAANSRDVLDFMLLLSPNDMWSGWTDPRVYTDDSGVSHAGLRTNDTTCTLPAAAVNNPEAGTFVRDTSIGANGKFAVFNSDSFTGAYNDGANGAKTAKQRVGEGHLEFIAIASFRADSTIGVAATHGDNGQPDSCTTAANLINLMGNDIYDGVDTIEQIIARRDPKDLPTSVGNVLAANAYLINVESGQGAGYDPVILSNFRSDFDESTVPGYTASIVDAATLLTQAVVTDQKPDMDSASPVSNILSADGSSVISDNWGTGAATNNLGDSPFFTGNLTGGADAVSAVLSRASITNEWAASPDGATITDYFTQWVATFPTKHFYVDMANDSVAADDIAPTLAEVIGNGAIAPFSFEFDESETIGDTFSPAGASCEAFDMVMFDREESRRDLLSPASGSIQELCYETNVISFDSRYAPEGLTSSFNTVINEIDFPYDAATGDESTRGWASLTFSGSAATSQGLVGDSNAYYGLPVTGFMLSVYNTVDGAENNHTTINEHKYTRDIVPAIF